MAYTKRDSKDPLPTADNVYRENEAGNVPVTGERHNQKKATKISADSRFGSGVGPDQPTRQGEAGNTPVVGESHDQKKASKIPASSRF